MSIVRYVEKINSVIPDADKEFFAKMSKERFPEYHKIFGKWVRENCHLWKNGTNDFQKDLKILEEKGYVPNALQRIKNKKISSLKNYENASHVLMDIYHDVCNHKVTKEELSEWGV